ncbi:MAG: glycosyltransferase [Oscillospiraceae bacterium]|nr:glycosyltransferase [Oscillospiraceae bacterium]
MEPVRVLHMIGNLGIGGSQVLVINLLRAIDRSKVQFDFIVDRPESDELAAAVRELGSRIYSVPTFVGHNIREVQKAWNQFFLEHPEYKILHSHVRSYASIYLPIAKKHGLKTIIHSHSTSNGKGLVSAVKKVLQYPLRYQADYFFSCSEEAGKWLFGNKIVKCDRHYLLRNAVDAKAYLFNEETRQSYRQALAIGENDTVYSHVGRLHPSKNHTFLLNVFKKIHTRNPDTKLLLIGDGELRQQIEQQIAELSIHDAILLLGSRQDIPQLLQAADFFLFPSLWEGLGLAAIEAQAAGLGCICSDQVPPLVKVTENCHFLPLDEEQWVTAALNAPKDRVVAYEQIQQAGYDIYAAAQWLAAFYEDLWQKA